jgi:putative addiction module CopG family antidote
MTHQLTDQHEVLIQRLVATGRFVDANHVISEALSHLEAHEQKLDDLRAELQIGRDDIARGDVHEYTPQLREQIRLSARRRAQDGGHRSADVAT